MFWCFCGLRFSELDRNAGLDSLDLTDTKTGMRPLVLWPEVGFGDAGRRGLGYGSGHDAVFFGRGERSEKKLGE